MKNRMKNDIFISYRRDGGAETAKHLHDTLTRKGYRVFYDIESLRSGPFNEALYDEIDAATDFLLVLPPHGMDRCADEGDWVRLEIERALEKEKNIIPIMLRGFEFPSNLPESLSSIPLMNGLQANTDYFDAFINRLTTQFLKTPKPFPKPLKWVLIAVLAVAIAAAGFLTDSFLSKYPHNAKQRNTVSELITYLVTNADQVNAAADQYTKLTKSVINYYEGNSTKDVDTLRESCDYVLSNVDKLKKRLTNLDDSLRKNLEDSPLNVGDIIACPVYMELVLDEVSSCTQYMKDYFLGKNLGDYGLPIDATLEQLNAELERFKMEGSLIFYTINETLLPVNDESALHDYLTTYWPQMTSLADPSQKFTYNRNDIEQQLNTVQAKLDKMNQDINDSLDQVERETQEAIAKVKQEAYEKFKPLDDDPTDLLWGKALRFIRCDMPEAAVECFAKFVEKSEGDADAAVYGTAAQKFVRSMKTTGITGGCIVGLYEPGLPKQAVEIGDIIYEVDGKKIFNFADYNALKDQKDRMDIKILRFIGDNWTLVDSVIDNSLGRIGLLSLNE